MENVKKYAIRYFGKGGDLFVIQIVNLLLTVITLGLYYPWAKARTLQYMYSTTEFEGSPFQFHGTGKEMFKGFIKVIFIIGALFAIYGVLTYLEMVIIGTLVLYLGFIALMPLAIHGSYRYRMSRTTWRGIRFGYRGDKVELIKQIYRDLFLTIITLGFYGAWFTVNLRSYIISHIRFGSTELKWNAHGSDYFWMNVGGYFATIFTFGIYAFWWQKNLFEYFVNHLSAERNGEHITFRSTATGGDFAGLIIVNLLIIIFTFGLGIPWAVVRMMNFVFANIEMEGNLDLEQIVQTEQDFNDATGEDLADFLDFDFVI